MNYKKPSMEDLQEKDLRNIKSNGFSFNLIDTPKYECYKDGDWRDVMPCQSLYELTLMDIPVRKKQPLKSL